MIPPECGLITLARPVQARPVQAQADGAPAHSDAAGSPESGGLFPEQFVKLSDFDLAFDVHYQPDDKEGDSLDNEPCDDIREDGPDPFQEEGDGVVGSDTDRKVNARSRQKPQIFRFVQSNAAKARGSEHAGQKGLQSKCRGRAAHLFLKLRSKDKSFALGQERCDNGDDVSDGHPKNESHESQFQNLFDHVRYSS